MVRKRQCTPAKRRAAKQTIRKRRNSAKGNRRRDMGVQKKKKKSVTVHKTPIYLCSNAACRQREVRRVGGRGRQRDPARNIQQEGNINRHTASKRGSQ